jgi:predicted nucleic acid-binding protein
LRFLLDTLVVCEPTKKSPNANVLAWLTMQPLDQLHLSAMTFGEIAFGIEKVADSVRKETLRHWIGGDIRAGFAGRILGVDQSVVDAWVRLRGRAGRSLGYVDSVIAATAAANGLILVTRNIADFADMGLALHNPSAP